MNTNIPKSPTFFHIDMYTNISKSTIILSGIPLYIRDSDYRYTQPSKLHYAVMGVLHNV